MSESVLHHYFVDEAGDLTLFNKRGTVIVGEQGGLQVIDYYLWAIQRMYETGEDRFFNLLRSDYRLIMDLDDKRNDNYGEWYSDENPISVERIRLPAG